MKFDVVGRINNMRLPDGKAAILFSVYEAVSNSVHAIEDKFGKDNIAWLGSITVDVSTDEEGYVSEIAIIDNGTGFTPNNIIAFDTSDSRFKENRGGKGVGRLIWIKVFEEIRVDSRYSDENGEHNISFYFKPDHDNSVQFISGDFPLDLNQGSRITLRKIRESQREKMRKISFLRDLALHFFSYFMAGSIPRMTVTFDGASESLEDFISNKIDNPTETTFSFKYNDIEHSLSMFHIYVDSTISAELKNSILFTAHHRLVGEPISIERRYALNELSGRKAYVGLVSGKFLDDRVDQERLAFRLTPKQDEALRAAALDESERFLQSHIENLRTKQKITIESLLEEHPQLAAKISDVDDYVKGLYPGMDEEQIGENLFTLLYREERKISRKIREFTELETLNDENKSEAESVLAKVTDQAKHRLAELVVKRRQILSLARSFLKYKEHDSTKYHYERAVHDLICPLGEIYTSNEYTSHNLWIVDDLLAYYSFFASDKQLKSLATDSDSQKEPDLIFFNPLGFRREGTNDPVVLVEFKRPGDEQLSQDPVNQVLDYVEKLKNKTVRDVEGEVVSEIRQDTPFECYVVCDLTEGARKLLSRSLAPYETPDGEGYYGFAPNHKASIRVISYKKLLRDAELRNQVFFAKLGLINPR